MRRLRLVTVVRAAARADEVIGSLTITGGDVRVTVRHPDGRPAVNVPVRLLDAQRLTVAVARTDAAGRWDRAALAPGSYEAVIEPPSSTDTVTRLPFVIGNPTATDPARWAAAAVGVLCLGGAAVTWPGRRPLSRLCTGSLLATGTILQAWVGWFREPPAPDVARAARDYLRERDVRPLTEPIDRLVTVPGIGSQPHPLLGRAAPDFTLFDHAGQPWQLRDQRGPVVLVFYLGYHCNHCVGQLFALHADLAKFRELGATVVAVSPDPPAWTREQFRKYGSFDFPILADPGNVVARQYGVYLPANEDALHGTFVIGRDGRVRWAQTGAEPFTDNRALLAALARE